MLPLYDLFPRLDSPWVSLGEWPTPVQRLDRLQTFLGAPTEAYVKRDDLSSKVYGGNKVRTLEFLFGQALSVGATRIASSGAYGSNHGVATLMHAPRVGLECEVLLFPQPAALSAVSNLDVMMDADRIRFLPHWSVLPWSAFAAARDPATVVMPPGGANPEGALGYVNAALELAHQVHSGELPSPTHIVVPAGSTCTAAGLLLGVWLAQERGMGWRVPPRIVAVRVTPWPVTSKARILHLARATGAMLARRASDASGDIERSRLAASLRVDGAQMGRGYGHATSAGLRAMELFDTHAGLRLEPTYSAKAAAAVLDAMSRPGQGPVLFWSTKSAADPQPSGRPPSGVLARWWRGRALATST